MENYNNDDIDYAIDLGLVRRGKNGLEIGNKIYSEVIPRELSYTTQIGLETEIDRLWFEKEDGSIDIEKLLQYFQQFFRENSEIWIERFDYKEAGPQLLMQAFLQRVINGGGAIHREYGLARKRTDLMVEWKNGSKFVIELKILYNSLEATIEQGLEQIWEYMDRCGCDVGNLMIFDRAKDKSWDEKIFRMEREYKGKRVIIWGS